MRGKTEGRGKREVQNSDLGTRNPESWSAPLPPRVVIGAPQGRSGKTTVTIAVGRALLNRGMIVQPFKKGPDYIDPSWIGAACGRTCYNLDAFLLGGPIMAASFARRAMGADIALVEGAMGLFDGAGTEDGEGTVAALSRTLGAPVILVVNAARMTRSAAAMVSGFQHFEPGTNIGGVIFNNVSGSRHERSLTEAIKQHCGVPVLGTMPKGAESYISERHLGLVPTRESERAEGIIEAISRRAEGHLNIDGIVELARRADNRHLEAVEIDKPPRIKRCRIGILYDRVFNFYYPENLEALSSAGAELVFLNSEGDRLPADVDGLYVGGGFPELYCKELEANGQLRQDIACRVEEGMPVYAECAGLMYLCRAIRWKRKRYEMAGVIPAEVELSERPAGHGYVQAQVVKDNPFFVRGAVLRGHEFHHSRLGFKEGLEFVLKLSRGQGIDGKGDGIVYRNLFAAYTHIHALGVPDWAGNFVGLVMKRKKIKAKAEVENRSGKRRNVVNLTSS